MKRRTSFMRLVGYEGRKAFASPWLLLFLLLLLMANGLRLQQVYARSHVTRQMYQAAYEEIYEQLAGPIREEKIQWLMQVYSAASNGETAKWLESGDVFTGNPEQDEAFLKQQFVAELKYDYYYAGQARQLVRQAEEAAKRYRAAGNSYAAERCRWIQNDFRGRGIARFTDTRTANALVFYDMSLLPVLLLCLVGLSSMFVTEKESEMRGLLATMPGGGQRTTAAKLAAAALYTTTVCLLFWSEDFWLLYTLGNLREVLRTPAYALACFGNGPLRMSLGGYLLWSAGVRLLGIWGCSALVLLLSCRGRSVLGVNLTGLLLLAGLFGLQKISRTFPLLRWLNPMESVFARELVVEEAFVKLGGHALPLYLFVLAGTGLELLLTVGVLVRLDRKRHIRRTGKKEARPYAAK